MNTTRSRSCWAGKGDCDRKPIRGRARKLVDRLDQANTEKSAARKLEILRALAGPKTVRSLHIIHIIHIIHARISERKSIHFRFPGLRIRNPSRTADS
jgi:hypothetical protein